MSKTIPKTEDLDATIDATQDRSFEWTAEKRATVEELATRLLNLWEVSPEDHRRLLGRDMDTTTEDEILDRIGWLLSIHRCLRLLYPKNPEIRYSWISRRHEAFGWKSPLDILVGQGVKGMKQVAGYLQGIISR